MKSLLLYIKNSGFLSIIASLGKNVKNIPLLPVIADEQLKFFTFVFYPVKFKKMKEFVDSVVATEELATGYHRYGGIEFLYNEKKLAHMHSNGLLDISFPGIVKDSLIEKRLCVEHHINSGLNWISFYIDRKTNLAIPIQLIKWSKQLKMKTKSVSEIGKDIDNFQTDL